MTQKEQDKRILELEELLIQNGIIEKPQELIPTYSFSKIGESKLQELFDIRLEFDKSRFNTWFNYNYQIPKDDIDFLSALLDKFSSVIYRFKEESLKVLFISQILNRVDFFSLEHRYTGLYDEPLIYKTDEFILNGETDFTFAKGVAKCEKPYFFIQEFKQEKGYSEPEYQLLAELISAVELNSQTIMKGAYIKGTIWRFVILERLDRHKYRYFVSINFDSTKLDDLKAIYKNLIFIKNEVLDREF